MVKGQTVLKLSNAVIMPSMLLPLLHHLLSLCLNWIRCINRYRPYQCRGLQLIIFMLTSVWQRWCCKERLLSSWVVFRSDARHPAGQMNLNEPSTMFEISLASMQGLVC